MHVLKPLLYVRYAAIALREIVKNNQRVQANAAFFSKEKGLWMKLDICTIWYLLCIILFSRICNVVEFCPK